VNLELQCNKKENDKKTIQFEALAGDLKAALVSDLSLYL